MSKTLTAKSLLAITATGALVAMTPGVVAFASPTCSAGGTLISSGVCELKFTEPGSHTFTPTSTMTKVDALIVGAGGKGEGDGRSNYRNTYGGGGGDVKLVTLANDTAVTLVVGAGGTGSYSTTSDSAVTQGTAVNTTAGGGHEVSWRGGASGNGNTGSSAYDGGPDSANGRVSYGGGAGAGAGANSKDGGTGIVVNTITGASTSLFATDTNCYGGGGSAGVFYAADDTGNPGQVTTFPGAAICGGGGVNISTNGQAFVSYSMISPVANSGSGGGGFFHLASDGTHNEVAQNGSDGVVIIRYEFAAPALANTGSTGLVEAFAAGFGLLGLGVGAFATRRRAKSTR